MSWLPILTSTLVLDKPLIIRTADTLGLGRSFDVVNYDATFFTEEEAVMSIQNQGDFIEFMEVPE
jgi:hypothetical protein